MMTVSAAILIGILCFLFGVCVGFAFNVTIASPIDGESLREAYRREQNSRIDRFGD